MDGRRLPPVILAVVDDSYDRRYDGDAFVEQTTDGGDKDIVDD